ncbi:MAG: BrnT family toxin [Patescibacteria group bacterium]
MEIIFSYRGYDFVWNRQKEVQNIQKHGVKFSEAVQAFYDPQRLVSTDLEHSSLEARYFCIGTISKKILTVRFTLRGKVIRIIGAGYWRKGKKLYEKINSVH